MPPVIKQLAEKRRSIRKFKPTEIPIETILEILETTHYAPSGANEQPWRFIVITNPETKKRIRAASEKGEKEMYAKVSGEFKVWLQEKGLSPDKPFLEEAPVLIIVLMRRDTKYARESIWLSVGYLLLALEEHGLGTVPYTPSNTSYPFEALMAPSEYNLEVILPVGYPNDTSPKTERASTESFIYHNYWGNKLPK